MRYEMGRDEAMSAADRIAQVDDASDDVDARAMADELRATYVDLWDFLGDGDVHEGYRLWLEENDPRPFVRTATAMVMDDVSGGKYGLGYELPR